MLKNLTAPYRFVPINSRIYIPNWWNLISQDIPFSDAEDGSIQLEFRNLTPILVGGMKDTQKDITSPLKCNMDGKVKYFIPGSSWKGMVRSIFEVLSFSKMQQFDDATFGYRDLGNVMKVGYNSKMEENEKCGWLRKEMDTERYYVLPCADIQSIEIDSINSSMFAKGLYSRNGNIIEKLKGFGDEYPQIIQGKYKGKYLAFSGAIGGKRHEYIFDDPEKIGMKKYVSKEVVDNFRAVYRDSPYNDRNKEHFIDSRLDDGRELPVFYHTERNGEISHIGLTKYYRLPYEYSVRDCVKQEKVNGRDLAECIFGYVDGKDCLKGRVQFESTLIDAPNVSLAPSKGVLAQPKASYFPFYLKQGGSELKTYSNVAEIAGRKSYAIHKENTTLLLPQGNDNQNVLSTLEFIPAGQVFTLVVYFHNLRAVELGALLSALTFHNTRGMYYNMGMAKGYGYGKLQLDWDTIKMEGTKNKDREYYLSMFETMMTEFEPQWRHSEQVKMLLGIYSGQLQHSDLRTMSLDERGSNPLKRETTWAQGRDPDENRNPQNLFIPRMDVKSIQSEEAEYQTYWQSAVRAEMEGKLDEAKSEYKKIIDVCKQNNKYREKASEQIQRIESTLSELLRKAEEFENGGDIVKAIEFYKRYESASGASLASKVLRLEDRLGDEAAAAEREGQYEEAMSRYQLYEQISGIPQCEAIERCQHRMQEKNKPIGDVLLCSSVGAFVGSVAKYLKMHAGSLSEQEMQVIKERIGEKKQSDAKKWTNVKEWNKQLDKSKEFSIPLKETILLAVEN